jgi:hypothetical protein
VQQLAAALGYLASSSPFPVEKQYFKTGNALAAKAEASCRTSRRPAGLKIMRLPRELF